MNSTKRQFLQSPSLKLAAIMLLILFGLSSLVYVTTSAQSGQGADNPTQENIVQIAPGSAYRQTNLVSDWPGMAIIQDSLLVNPWGISMTATSPFWVANSGTGTSTLYRGDVGGILFGKNPGLPSITIPGSLPTGTVANPTAAEFVLPGACSAPPCGANFIFASITGTITGWDPNAPAAGSTTGVIAASQPGHVYTGLAIGNNGVGNFLYAADFANGRIDVFNSAFALQPTASFPFADPTIPKTAGNTYNPYNIQAIGSSLYVTYAKVGVGGKDEEGIGNGFVRRFNMNGVRDLTFGINNGPLNSPWGITVAPASFGIFGGALLVGNFGRGNPSIHAFNPTTGAFLGTLQNEGGAGIEIDELWALTFGNVGSGGDPNTLYFTAGIGQEDHGLFGSLKPTTASATSLVQISSEDYTIGEGNNHIDITVTRSGDVSGTATVNYTTFDQNQPGRASQKSDYELAVGKLTFSPGETSKTFSILLVDDKYDENDETLDIYISNPTGAGLGVLSKAVLTITDNDTGVPTTNPIDGSPFFVRQHYLDFLEREPETAGFNYWTGILNGCGADASCLNRVRVEISSRFFIEMEFQQTGFYVMRLYKASYGRSPSYAEFMTDRAEVQNSTQSQRQFANTWVNRSAFITEYPATLTPAQFVKQLYDKAGVADPSARAAAEQGLTNGTKTRADVVFELVQLASFRDREYNPAFVRMLYFGYLRRDPDTAGENYWLGVLTNNYRVAVCGFVNSAEYQLRFAGTRGTFTELNCNF
jgi:uncharacterized protein (TIGR03118 family)